MSQFENPEIFRDDDRAIIQLDVPDIGRRATSKRMRSRDVTTERLCDNLVEGIRGNVSVGDHLDACSPVLLKARAYSNVSRILPPGCDPNVDSAAVAWLPAIQTIGK